MLIASRALLGIAGATLMPSTMSLIRNMFLDPRQRTAAIGVWVSGFSVGSAVGPLIGGALLENFWWGSVFLLGVPVMAGLLIAGPSLLPEYKDPNPGRFDLLSAFLSLAAVLSVIYGLKQMAEYGLGLVPAVFIIVGLIIGAVFVQRQRTLADPLIDLKLFRVRAFSAALATYTFGIFVSFGTFLFIAQYLQLVLGLSPLNAGLWSIPGAVAFILGSNLAPRVVRSIRPAYVVAGGLIVAAVGMTMILLTGVNSLALIVVGNILMSIGFGFTFSLTVDLVVSAAPPERAGAASALAETGAEFGGALGLAVLGSLGMAIYRQQITATMPAGVTPEVVAAVQETLGGAVATAASLPDPLGSTLLHNAQLAFVQGLHINAAIGVIGFIGLAILTATMLRHIEIHGESEAEFEGGEALPTGHTQSELSAGD
ncbi:MAG: MFS transporter, partial [Anaerolineae bacterium]|nr:MFS transporter [Anaerolineae bacterium]